MADIICPPPSAIRRWCAKAGITGLDLETALMSWAKDPTSADGSRIQRVIEAHVGIQIPGVPPTITREDYRALVGSVGLDPAQLLSLTFGHASIEAEVFALDHEGRRYAEGNEVATHRVRIEVVD